MIGRWFRDKRRQELLAEPAGALWDEVGASLPFYGRLAADDRNRLVDIARVLVAEKNWEGIDGLEVTEAMKAVVALQAGLLILELEHDYYDAVMSILLYPDEYASRHAYVDDHGIVTEGRPVLGEAVHRDAVLLSWSDARAGIQAGDGFNLVFHEFAHQLDMQDGRANGTPPLEGGREAYARWKDVMQRHYTALVDDVEAGRDPLLDPYGATNEAEFFAVVTETFFDAPEDLAEELPELYGLLADYYGQDPAARE